MLKKRLLFYEIMPHISHKNALIITGMRQVGKSTLMRQLFDELNEPNKLWFDFDNPLDQKLFEDIEYHNIHKRLIKKAKNDKKRLFVFIDEIQNLPEITKVIKFLIDHYGIKFIVTGSSNFYLKNLFPESLSGRKFLYHLKPLNFKEYLYFNNQINLKEAQKKELKIVLNQKDQIFLKQFEEEYINYLEFGGFPEVVTTKDDKTKRMILKNIFASFFEKDLKILSDYKDIRELRDLILLLVPRIGSLLDISKLASELSVDRKKIYEYLEFLQGTFFVTLLQKYSKSIDRSVAGGRKIYFTDTGILNMLGSVNDSQLFENAVINQLSDYGEISFYNKKNTIEIDAILDKKNAFEIKLTGTDIYYNKLKNTAENLDIKKYYIISKKIINRSNFISPIGL